MWGARFTELVDPSPFPLFGLPLGAFHPFPDLGQSLEYSLERCA